MSAVLDAREPSARCLEALRSSALEHFDLVASCRAGVAQLRELILTLAIQGKLVPQDWHDTPAAAACESMEDSHQTSSHGRSPARKAPPSGDLPYALPSSWVWVRLGDCAHLINGDRGSNYPSRDKLVDRGVAFINAGHLQNGVVDRARMNFISEHHFHLLRTGKVRRNDILYCLRGSLGKFALVSDDLPGAIASSLVIIRAETEQLVPYLSTYLASPLAHQEMRKFDNGTAQPNLGARDLAKFLVPLPPPAEQARIVARVGELLRLCDALEEKGRLEADQHAHLLNVSLDTLTNSASPEQVAANWQRVAANFDLLLDRPEAVDALDKAILELAVRGMLVPQDATEEPAAELLHRMAGGGGGLSATAKARRREPLVAVEVPFDLPHGWAWARFEQLIDPKKPISYGVLVPGPEVADGVPFVRVADLSISSPAATPEKRISPLVDAQYQRSRLEGGEILMGVVGSIGKLGVAPQSWAGANIARAICRIVPAAPIDRSFVLLLLESEFMQRGFAGDTRTLAQPTLNVGLIRTSPTPVPPLAEQRRIVARVEQLRRVCSELRDRVAAARGRQALLAATLIELAENGHA